MNKKSKVNKSNTPRGLLIIIGVVILLIATIVFLSQGDNKILKSEYSIGEVGYIDDIELSLKEVTYINDASGIEVAFEITNKRDNTITIIPDDYFVFYDVNQVQIPNKFTNDINIIKKDETIIYKLQYDVTKKELYEIYFYSQVVENNIMFSFNSNDIKYNDNLEQNVVPEDSINDYE